MKEFEENEKLTDPEAVSSAQDDSQTDFAQEETAAQSVADRTSETEQPSEAADETAGFEESLDKNLRPASPRPYTNDRGFPGEFDSKANSQAALT